MSEYPGFPILAAGLCCAAGLERHLSCLQIQAEADVFESYSFWTDHPEDDDFAFPFAGLAVFANDLNRANRMAHLLVSALDECLASAGELPENTPLLLAVPRNLTEEEAELLDNVVGQVAAQRGVSLAKPRWIRGGREASGAALVQATVFLQAGMSVLVAAVDSLCDAETLKALQETERLLEKGPDGLIPGEAAACMFLGPSAASEGTRLRAAAVRSDGGSETVRSQRHHLTAVFEDEQLKELEVFPAQRVYLASTGEGFLAQDVSHTYLRHAPWWPEPLDIFELAGVLGDTGAAGGLVQCLFADFQLQRTQTPQTCRRALVVTAADSDAGAVAVLEHGPVS